MTPTFESAVRTTLVLHDSNPDGQQTPPGRPALSLAVARPMANNADASPAPDVILHAGVDKLRVHLRRGEDELELTITGNGEGFKAGDHVLTAS
jgi:hypothetical protein